MADYEGRDDRFTEVEDMYDGYQVNGEDGQKIGKVDNLFVDENDRAEYIGVKMGLLGMNSTLIPMDACRIDGENQEITVAAEKDHVQNGPDFDDDKAITPDFERRVREHYGLESYENGERGAYGGYYSDDEGDIRSESVERDEDELSVERKEEELRAGTREREREDSGVKVRKRAKIDRERVRVPKKREEVTVERVSMDDAGSDTETVEEGVDSEEGEEIQVPVMEEEVVTDKREVTKEEIRVSKDVVEDEEVVEEDVRKEEIDIEGERRDG